jgi:hypothetical protein
MLVFLSLQRKIIFCEFSAGAYDTGFSLAYWAPNFTAQAVFDRAEKEIMAGLEMRTAADEFRILKGEALTIKPKITLRTLSAADASSSSTLIKDLVTALEKARDYYSKPSALEALLAPFRARWQKAKP